MSCNSCKCRLIIKQKMELKNIEISAYRNKESQSRPVTIKLISWLTTDKYKIKIEELRSCCDVDKKANIKSSLPCCKPSGIFNEQNKLVLHSGLMAIDIDGKDNPTLSAKEIKYRLLDIVNVAFAGFSCSGFGVWALIPIKDPTRHLEHFKALEIVFSNIGIKIDPACSDVTRMRFASYDSEPYINENAKVFSLVLAEVMKPKVSLKSESFQRSESCFDSFNHSADVVGLLENHGWKITRQKGDRVYFQRPGKDGTGVSGNFNLTLRLFTTWSSSTVFEPRKAYNASQIFNLLECSDDWKETAKRLKQLNY